MILTTLSPRQLGRLCAVSFTTAALVLGMSLPGCVKSPREFLSSLRQPKEEVEESSEESEAVADAANPDTDLKTAKLSRSESDRKDLPEESEEQNLLDRLLSRTPTDTDGRSTDPFIESDAAERAAKQEADETVAKAEAQVQRRAATLEELLAQSKPTASLRPETAKPAGTPQRETATSTSATSGPSDENLFAAGFDSRLDRLKADLQREPSAATGEASEGANPFADFVNGSRDRATSTSGTDQTTISSVSLERKVDRSPRDDAPLTAESSDAKVRVQALLKQAHEDWNSWKLEEAYRKALAAQELSVLEGVEFDVSDERPSELAKRIASDIRKDSLASTAKAADPWTDRAAAHEDAFSEVAGQAFSSFTAGTSTIGWQPAASRESSTDPQPQADVPLPQDEAVPTGRSGVNLLPPSLDDFPSEAEGNSWQSSSSAETTHARDHRGSTNAVVNLAWPDESKPARSRTDELTGDGPTLVRYDSDVPVATAPSLAEERDDLLALAAATRNRVLQPENSQWPTLPSPETSPMREREEQADPVAVAAPILLGVNDTPAAGVTKSSTTLPVATVQAVEAPSIRSWFPGPTWFVGGLVLLMVAMRLLSRRTVRIA